MVDRLEVVKDNVAKQKKDCATYGGAPRDWFVCDMSLLWGGASQSLSCMDADVVHVFLCLYFYDPRSV